MNWDQQDRLINALDDFKKYPTNISDPIINIPRYAKMLNDQTLRPFNAQDTPIEFIEMLPGDMYFEVARIKDVKAYLTLDRPDPKCRFVFLFGRHDKSRLGYSKEQLQYVLTHHQVGPSFLDFIFPFGAPSPGLTEFAGFRQHDTVLDLHDHREAIPRLGRSGSFISHAFLLHSPSVTNESVDKWSIRQAAIYHQFDVQTGQTLWIISQGDDNLLDRLRRMAVQADSPLADDFADPTTSFRSSLIIHQLFFEWSIESWRDYIGQLERDLEQIRNHIIIDDSEMGPELRLDISERNPYGNRTRYGSCGARYGMPILDNNQYVVPLYEFEMKMREALRMLEQTGIVHDALVMHFQKIMEYEEFPSRMKDMAYYEVLRFSECATNAHAELALRQRDAESLLSRIQSTASLLSSMLEYRSAHPHNSTDQMHELARRTEKDLVSIKIITLVTMGYLPGTILATYLSLKPVNITPSDQIWSPFRSFLVLGFLAIATGLLYVGVQVRRRYCSPGQRYCWNVGFKEKHGQGA
ncbi:uncharacterized protein BDR25DRAFT_345292 [Lindgomyces ingoldianus]|uniref:Uncharacterized protein n=1 Tax=Lindgomyces ingoldianus TaxID=673940 RepID=A0ACB6QID2_9PLEO|nr:uncharacterized protein BDR25DRAFT_345292 [Lindgomyces ingoldianus]KAF2466681.1 hypothetical protein BDR25DRAFT_345292 [Lindgomyces ingoldianus]